MRASSSQVCGGVRLVIPRAYIQAWSSKAAWPDLRQVEQDLIICRALCDLFNASELKGKIAFRGGTAIHKLTFNQPLRYSEDIDLVQTRAEPIGATVDAIRAALSWLGKCKRAQAGHPGEEPEVMTDDKSSRGCQCGGGRGKSCSLLVAVALGLLSIGATAAAPPTAGSGTATRASNAVRRAVYHCCYVPLSH